MITNDEFERTWKEEVMASFSVLSTTLDEMRKTTKKPVRTAWFQAEISAWDLPNTKQDF
jgi:hypothetical protein